ncbi:bla regulator protein BlaR1 [Chryseobacterium sp. H1D6B]|uniref:M56 family metallopeptidase n=1 Tax=Chryseobacterium sp. H1D6B TaxID=2940588 RepID=UPI0015C83CB5|nr:M56 family metallopeptidase [Chryseobacterium sp. H1D6B]MDH6251488.1 bla regulator protein BlaR1 [Chryseobacterium sp. H1D6B]
METYFFKVIFASGICAVFYYLFLEKEKTLKFNRFFLISSLLFAYLFPFMKIDIEEHKEILEPILYSEKFEQINITPSIEQNSFNWLYIVYFVYAAVTAFLLIRFVIHLITIKTLQGRTLIYNNIKIKVVEKNIPPFSFLNTFYISENHYNNGNLDEKICLHEKNHIENKHSWDLILIEILTAFNWFNPSLYFYKKALVDNHEFSADEYVLKYSGDIQSYQKLILKEIKETQKLNLVHQFYFNSIKKRFIMMKKQINTQSKWKNYLSLPLFIVMAGFTVQKVNALNRSSLENSLVSNFQNTADENRTGAQKPSKEELETKIPSTKQDASVSSFKTVSDTIRPKKGKVKSTNEENLLPPPPHSAVLVDAAFPGGIDKLRTKIASTFDSGALKDKKGIMKTTAYLQIDETGKVKQVIASGNNDDFNNEIIRSITAANNDTAWKPATSDGKPRTAVFKLPVMMNFE